MLTRDNLGIIGQKKPAGHPIPVEGGDSVNWQGEWLYLNGGRDPNGYIIENVDQFIKWFEVAPGAYVRHFEEQKTKHGFGAHYRHAWDGCISRDQLIGILAALIAGKRRDAMWRVIKHHAKRLFLFAYNTIENGDDPNRKGYWKLPDFTGPNIWATEIRGLGEWALLFYPLLCVFDLMILGNAIVHNFKKTQHVISHIKILDISKRYTPTPFSLLAWAITDKEELLGEVDAYWCGKRMNCDFYLKWEKRIL